MRLQRLSIHRGFPWVPLARPMRGFALGSMPMMAITLSAAAVIFPVAAYGNIFVTNNLSPNFGPTCAVGEYTNSGGTINADLISMGDADGIAVSGSDLFITNVNAGTVGEYTTAGATVNADLISGLTYPQFIAVSGSDLLVTNEYAGTIMEYTTGGALINADFISGLNEPSDVAVSGTDLFIAVTAHGSGQIGEYTTAGATVNADLIPGMSGPLDIAISGSDMFVTSQNHTVGEYTTAGATVNADLIPGLSDPWPIAVLGSNLFIAESTGNTVGEYTTSGGVVNNELITALSDPEGIAVTTSQYLLTWDPAASHTGSDGTGTWGTSTAVWATGASDSGWVNGDIASIGSGGAGAVITIDAAGITAAGLTFNSAISPYTIASAAGDNLTLSGAVTMNANATISPPIVGTGSLTITGSKTLTLSGANTYTGGTTLQGGVTVAIGGGGSINGTSALTIATGANLNLTNTAADNGIVIDYGTNPSPNSAIQAYVAGGAITTTPGYEVGYADGADGVVSGLSAGQEKIMATLAGDTNLAGTVTLGDYTTVYNNVGITSGATWDQGDFTASGSVTLGDLTDTYNNVGASLTAGPAISASTSSGSNSKPIAAVMAKSLVVSTVAGTTPAVTDVSLTVNTATGDAMLVFNNPSAQFYAWEITSKTGGLRYTNLTDPANYTTGPRARGPNSLDGVYYTASAGGYYNPGGTWNLGDILTPGDITSGALDFMFNEFNPSSGLSVTFDPGTINYTAVPEPATLGLFALGGLGLLLLASRKRKARA